MLPLLCAVREAAAIAVAPASEQDRTSAFRCRSTESTTAGQKPIRKTAATAFGYEIGNESRRPQ